MIIENPNIQENTASLMDNLINYFYDFGGDVYSHYNPNKERFIIEGENYEDALNNGLISKEVTSAKGNVISNRPLDLKTLLSRQYQRNIFDLLPLSREMQGRI